MKKGHALVVLAENALQLTSTKPAISEAGHRAKFGSTKKSGELAKTNMVNIGFVVRIVGSPQECNNAGTECINAEKIMTSSSQQTEGVA